MKSSEIFLVFAEKTADNLRLLARARELQIKLTPLPLQQITVALDESGATRFFLEARDITTQLKKGRIIFRGKGACVQTALALAHFAQRKKIPFTDSVASIALVGKSYLPNVILRETQHIPSIFWETQNELPRKISFRPPFIVKPLNGNRGRSVRVVKKLNKIKTKNWEPLIIQPQLNFEEEFRIFVLNGKVLAAVAKRKSAGALAANFAQGADFVAVKIARELQNEAIQICRQLGIEIGGVDFARIGRKYYFLEANRAPGIIGVERATGIDVGGAILRFIQTK
ncbi:MAG: hypothetical protein V2A63_03435 [Patescibacteria group bacterium]